VVLFSFLKGKFFFFFRSDSQLSPDFPPCISFFLAIRSEDVLPPRPYMGPPPPRAASARSESAECDLPSPLRMITPFFLDGEFFFLEFERSKPFT